MEPNDIRRTVGAMWLTTPETELLGCIAVALAEILETITRAHRPGAVASDRCHAASGSSEPTVSPVDTRRATGSPRSGVRL